MSGLFQKREKLHRGPVRRKKGLKFAPEYLIPTLWILFTLTLLDWVLLTSFSTTKEIFSNKLLDGGFHMENYVKAWISSNISTIFFNFLFYTAVSCTLLVLIYAPTACALSYFDFACNGLIQSSLMAPMGVPIVVIMLLLLAVAAGLNILDNVSASRATPIPLCIGINVPCTTIFLTTFFTNLPRAFEEAAAIDGCPPVRTFWLIMLSMAQSGVVTVTISNFINMWNEYFISLIFGNSDKVRLVAVGLYSMVNSMKYTGDRAGTFSAIVIVFLPTSILYIFPSEKTITGVTGGDVKGQDRTGNVKEQGYIL